MNPKNNGGARPGKKKGVLMILCKRPVQNAAGRAAVCPGVGVLRKVYLTLQSGQKHEVCEVLKCCACGRTFTDRNGHPWAVGPWIKRHDIKYFDVPRQIWRGDWAYRQKFAWEVLKMLEEDPRRDEFELNDVTLRLECGPAVQALDGAAGLAGGIEKLD